MKIEHLEYLIALQKAGSINKSAGLLHTSPQNVSRILKLLEDELEVELVDRSLSGVTFTAAGLGAVEMSKQIIALTNNYKRQFQGKSQTEGELILYATKIQSAIYLDDIIDRFSKLYPKINLNYHENDLFICWEKIRECQKCAGLIPVLEGSSLANHLKENDIDIKKLSTERIAVVVNKNSHMAKHSSVNYESLKGKNIVIYARNTLNDGFWSDILQNFIVDVANINVATNGKLFFNKIIDDDYIGLGCEKTTLLSETLQNKAIRASIRVVPVRDEQAQFHNCIVTPKGAKNDQPLSRFLDFMEAYVE